MPEKKRGEFKEDFADLMRNGFTRLRIDGAIIELTGQESLDEKAAHDIDLVIDRLVVSPDARSRLAEAASQALEQGKGFFSIYNPDTQEETQFSQFAYSPKSGLSYGPLEPPDFSFNHPAGMCPRCHGFGPRRRNSIWIKSSIPSLASAKIAAPSRAPIRPFVMAISIKVWRASTNSALKRPGKI